MVVSVDNAEHYVWGGSCDGWHLLKRAELSILQERVPAGGAEVMHYHRQARQFFYILEGSATMVFESTQVVLEKGEGLEISPGTRHQFRNQTDADVVFLVISVPPTAGDRVNC